jgi:hypothetical protein
MTALGAGQPLADLIKACFWLGIRHGCEVELDGTCQYGPTLPWLILDRVIGDYPIIDGAAWSLK